MASNNVIQSHHKYNLNQNENKFRMQMQTSRNFSKGRKID